MSEGLLSDADVGIAPAQGSGLLSDADVGLSPPADTSGVLTNTGDEGIMSGSAKNVATGAIKGAADAVGFAGNMRNLAGYLGDRGEQGVRYLAGYPKSFDQIQSDNAAAEARTAQIQSQSPIGQLDQAIPQLPSGQQIAAPILAKTGNYEPDSYAGQLAQTGIEAAVGSLGPAGGGATSGATRGALLGTITKQAPLVGTAGVVGQGVTDQTGDPLLGMAAGNLATGVAGGALHGANKVAQPFAEKLPVVKHLGYAGTQDRLAGQKLLANAQDPAAFQNALSPGPMQPGADEPIPGFQPTTAQLTGDPGIAQAERGDAAVNPAPYVGRRDAQNLAVAQNIDAMTPTGSPEAVTSHLQGQLASMDQDADTQIGLARQVAQQEASQIGTGVGPEVTGDELRAHVAMANKAASENASRLWKAIDPDNTLAASMSGIKDAAGNIYGNLTDTAKQFVSPEEGKFTQLISGYNPVEPFQQLGDLRSNLASAMRQERSTKGNTPALARMSQLMGSVQDNINNVVEHRAVQEAHAVSSGAMSPEDTMVARMRERWNVGAGQQAAGVQGYAAAGAGGSRGPAVSASSIPGTARYPGPRAGVSPGTSSAASGNDLVPNIDDAAVGRIKAATQATKQLHATYDNGVIGDLLASKGSAGDYKLSNSAVPAKVLPGGPREYDTVSQYRKATNNAPEAELSLHQAYAESARAKTIGADGMVDPAKLAQWKNLHQHGLRAMDEATPGFSNRFDNAAKATSTVMAETAAQRAARDHFQSGIVGKLLGADGEDEVINRFGRIMNADDRVAQINKLIAAARGNPDAREGLRKTAASWMARQFKTQTEIGSSGTKQVSANAFKKIVADKAPVLSRLFSTDEMGNFQRIAHALDIQNRSITSKIAGSPGTAQDLNQAAKGHGHGNAKPASNLMEAIKNGAQSGWFLHGLHGAAWGAATGASGHILSTLRAMGIENINALYTDALLNPERARYYLSKVPAPADHRLGRAIAGNLRRSFLIGPQVVRTQNNQRASGGRVEGGPGGIPEHVLRILPKVDPVESALRTARAGGGFGF